MEFIRDNMFRANGLELFPNSAEMHYWRIERKNWPFAFRQAKEAGFKIISTCVPWNFHEYEQGKFDFIGETDPQRDLVTFLGEARSTGLRVILKPGPWISAEWENGGLPDYLFESSALVARDAEDEAVHAGSKADVTPGYAPCYAHPEYLKHVRRYFTALIQEIRDFLPPDGNIFLIQLDNEISHCYKNGIFDADYHELVTMNLYPRFIKDRYKEIEKLNSIYLTDLQDFSQCAPPRKLEVRNERDLVKYFDWIEFKERYLATYLVQLKKILTDLNANTGFMTNIYWDSDFSVPTSWPMFAKYAGFTGINVMAADNYQEIQRYARYLETTSEMAWAAQFRAGSVSDDPEGDARYNPITEEQQQFLVLSSLAAGLRGANYHMFVGRDHWYDSPVTVEGKRSKSWDFYKKLNEILDDYDYFEVEKINNVGVVNYQPYTRYSYIDPEKPFDHIKNLVRKTLPDLCTDLAQQGVDYTIADPAVPESLEKHDVLFVPVADYMDDKVVKYYAQLAQQGKRIIFFGLPPTYDLLMRKSGVFSDTFGVRTARHLVVERMEWEGLGFRSLALGRLRLDEEWEPMLQDSRGNVYSARRKLGEGTVYFLGYDVASELVPEKKAYLAKLLEEVGAQRPVTVEEPMIEAFLKKSEKHTFLFLINPDQTVREEKRPTVRNATVKLDVQLAGIHADSITFVDIFTGEKINEPLAAVREGLVFEIGNETARMFKVTPEYGH